MTSDAGFQSDRTFLNKIMEVNDFTDKNAWEVIQFVYDATYMKYAQKFFQEKLMREAVEKRIINKNSEIDFLNGKLSKLDMWLGIAYDDGFFDDEEDMRALKELLGREQNDAGAQVSEAGEEATESDT